MLVKPLNRLQAKGTKKSMMHKNSINSAIIMKVSFLGIEAPFSLAGWAVLLDK
jgi:hypothetical protein